MGVYGGQIQGTIPTTGSGPGGVTGVAYSRVENGIVWTVPENETRVVFGDIDLEEGGEIIINSGGQIQIVNGTLNINGGTLTLNGGTWYPITVQEL